MKKEIASLWKEICFLLNSSKTSDLVEAVFEQKVVSVFEKCGWSEYKGEIILKKKIPLGSNQFLIPDIILENKEEKNSIVVEIKRPAVKIENERFKSQLFSYMRQLKIDFGLLIGENLQIFYDGSLVDSEFPLCLEVFEFSETENKNPLELLHKSYFTSIRNRRFVENTLKKINKKDEQNRLVKYIKSSDFAEEIKMLIEDYLKNDWNYDLVENVMTNCNVFLSINETEQDKKEPFSFKERKPNEKKLNREQIKAVLKNSGIETERTKLTFSNINQSSKWTFEIPRNDIQMDRFIVLVENEKQKIFLFKVSKEYMDSKKDQFYFRDDRERYRFEINSIDTKCFLELRSQIKFVENMIKAIEIKTT